MELPQKTKNRITIWPSNPTPVRMAIIKENTNKKCWRTCGEKGTFVHCWWECKLVQQLWKIIWSSFKKLKIELPYDLAIPLQGIYLKKTKTLIQKDTCTLIFIAVLFTIAKIRRQPKCPSMDRWRKYGISTHGKIFSLKQKGNPAICNNMDESGRHYAKWSKPEKDKYYMVLLTCVILQNKVSLIETEGEMLVARVWGFGEMLRDW